MQFILRRIVKKHYNSFILKKVNSALGAQSINEYDEKHLIP
jgi:hypothetical protein